MKDTDPAALARRICMWALRGCRGALGDRARRVSVQGFPCRASGLGKLYAENELAKRTVLRDNTPIV